MSLEDTIFYAFVTGEVSPAFWGRTDLSKYDLGAALLENYFVDYRGGAVSRQGSEFGGYLELDEGYKLSRFRGTNSDYLMVFSANRLRFMQNNSFVTLPPIPLTFANQELARFSSAGHDYETGDMVIVTAPTGMTELDQRQFIVSITTVNTFILTQVSGAVLDISSYTPFDGNESVAKVYTVETPYAKKDLYKLNVVQRYNRIRLTHQNYARRELTFIAPTNWALEELGKVTTVLPPISLSGTPSEVDDAGTSFAVTSVNSDGVESVISAYLLEQAMLNYTVTLGSYTLTWAVAPTAVSYNVYRGLVLPDGDKVTRGTDLAYIGSTTGNEFTDNNIVPDYTKTPPIHYNPFADNAAYIVKVLNPGSGYAIGTTMTLTGGGTNFIGYPVVNSSGSIGGVTIVSAGENYVAPTVALANTGGGAGATFEVITRGTPGKTNPALFWVFQQRGIYFATAEEPASLWASRPRFFDNYDYSKIVNAGDGYTFTIDSVAVEPIKHVLSIRNGMLIFTDDGITQLKAESGRAVSGVNALAEPQMYTGVSETPPIAVNLDVLFLTEFGASLKSLLYTEYTESFQAKDLSVLASHLFLEEAQITRMVHNANPHKLVYMPRSDGTMLTLTHVREQEVNGWARHKTMGNYKDMVEIREADASYVYQIVERFLQDVWQLCVERIPLRKSELAEDYWGVDAGVSLPLNYPAANLFASSISGETTLKANADVFTGANVDDVVYYAGGKLLVTGYIDERTLTAVYHRDATEFVAFGKEPIPQRIVAGRWSIATPRTRIGHIWHLEGQCVSICYDGDAQLDVEVTNGEILLPFPSTKVYVGLPYVCLGATLPLVVPNKVAEGQRNKIFAATPRVLDTRGMEFGSSLDDMEEMGDRTDEDWGATLKMRTDVSSILINSSYNYDAQILWRQRYPLPSSLLGFVVRSDVGEK